MNKESGSNFSQTSSFALQKETFTPLQYYTQGQRIIAFIIDIIILELPIALPFFISERRFNSFVESTPFYLLAAFIIFYLLAILAYFIYCEYKWGWTLGKKILGIKVFMEDGKLCTFPAAIIRNLSFLLDSIIPLGVLLDLIVLLKSRKKQRIGDFLAHTVVINVGQKHLRQPPYSEWADEETYPKLTSVK